MKNYLKPYTACTKVESEGYLLAGTGSAGMVVSLLVAVIKVVVIKVVKTKEVADVMIVITQKIILSLLQVQ